MKQLEESIRDVVFKQRCIGCKGFVFLIHAEKIEEKKIEGVITCSDCNMKGFKKENANVVFFLGNTNLKVNCGFLMWSNHNKITEINTHR